MHTMCMLCMTHPLTLGWCAFCALSMSMPPPTVSQQLWCNAALLPVLLIFYLVLSLRPIRPPPNYRPHNNLSETSFKNSRNLTLMQYLVSLFFLLRENPFMMNLLFVLYCSQFISVKFQRYKAHFWDSARKWTVQCSYFPRNSFVQTLCPKERRGLKAKGFLVRSLLGPNVPESSH